MTKEFSPTSPIPEVLTSDDTAKLIAEMYEIAGPRIGAFLVEANIVLTIAGARGQTEFLISNATPKDVTAIKRLAVAIESKGLSLHSKVIDELFLEEPTDLSIGLDSLRGYERVSRLTKIPGVIPYDSSTGWQGNNQWTQTVLGNMAEEQLKGNIPYSKDDVYHIFTGIVKGYPDQAIYDATDWWGINDSQTPIAHTEIKHVSKYGGSIPDFFIHPDHVNEQSIQETVTLWGKILEDFYNHPWHQMISEDPKFMAARSEIRP